LQVISRVAGQFPSGLRGPIRPPTLCSDADDCLENKGSSNNIVTPRGALDSPCGLASREADSRRDSPELIRPPPAISRPKAVHQGNRYPT
jgi:hypothetical protein